MDIITGKILKLNNWQDGRVIGLAKDAGNKLIEQGMDKDSALAKLEAVRQTPGSFLADPLFADLAREFAMPLVVVDAARGQQLLAADPRGLPALHPGLPDQRRRDDPARRRARSRGRRGWRRHKPQP